MRRGRRPYNARLEKLANKNEMLIQENKMLRG